MGRTRDRHRQTLWRTVDAWAEPLEPRWLLAATLLADLNVLTSESKPSDFCDLNGTAFFTATRPEVGFQLWKSDGTPGGTTLLKTFASQLPKNLTAWNGAVYFSAYDAATGVELWKSDGTAAGTQLVKDIFVGSASSSPAELTVSGGRLIFAARSSDSIWEIWRSDGSAANTTLVKRLNGSSQPTDLTDLNGTVFFSGTDSELWKTDGTAIGTANVKNFNPSLIDRVQNIERAGNRIFFTADPSNNTGRELYVSDGTSAGTYMLQDIYAGASSGLSATLKLYGASDGLLYFTAKSGASSAGFWRSDGTAAGTIPLRTITTTEFGSTVDFEYNGYVYFGSDGGEWKSDGTVAGTQFAFARVIAAHYRVLNGLIYFAGYDPIREWEVFRSDATESGTYPITNFNYPGPASFIGELGSAGNNLFLSAPQPESGDFDYPDELWTIHTTGAIGEEYLKDIAPGTASSLVNYLGKIGQTTFLSVHDGSRGPQLYKSDGTPSGTGLVKLIAPGKNASNPSNFTVVNGIGYFTATSTSILNGTELWRTDGTESGTYMVKDIFPGGQDSNPSLLTEMNGALYFRATDGVSGVELWKSDGTSAGTVMLKDINTGSSSANPSSLAVHGSTLYFAANSSGFGSELWKTDGTTAGTVRVKDIIAGSVGSAPQNMTPALGTVFFMAGATTSGNYELWKTDGTDAGTLLVKEINASGAAFTTGSFKPIALGARILFAANDGTSGVELWTSDGTSSGTMLARNIASGSDSSNPVMLAVLNGRAIFHCSNGSVQELWSSDGVFSNSKLAILPSYLDAARATDIWEIIGSTMYFQGTSAAAGSELWKTNGTVAGTTLAADIVSGASGSDPAYLMGVNGVLYFAATSASGARELWQSDGTSMMTVSVSNIWSGQPFGAPQVISSVGNRVIFTAASPTVGRELFVFDDFTFVAGTLTVLSTSNSNTFTLARAASALTLTTDAGPTDVPWVWTNKVIVQGGVGDDLLNLASAIDKPVDFRGGSGSDTLNLLAGTTFFESDAGATSDNLSINVAAEASLVLNSTQHLAALHVDGVASLSPGGGKVIVTRALTVSGRLNLADNGLLLDYTGDSPVGSWNGSAYTGVIGLLASGRSTGEWNGSGIVSPNAGGSGGYYTLGVGEASQLLGLIGTQTASWNGQIVDATTILVKYTYAGDANLSGAVDIDDYGLIDFNASTGGALTGWYNGDFDYNGIQNIDDYGIIDFIINIQGPPL